jgi:hypothetical protein
MLRVHLRLQGHYLYILLRPAILLLHCILVIRYRFRYLATVVTSSQTHLVLHVDWRRDLFLVDPGSLLIVH